MKKKKILWAIHPFASDAPILRSAARCLRDWVRAEPAWIEPVYVASSFRSLEQGSRAKVQSHGQAVIDRSGAPSSVPGLRPLRVLSKPVTSVRQEVRELVAYAKKTGADLIVISSHGRTGAERWLLGSFAETLSLVSDVPLLIVHPHRKRTLDFKTVLFPTDFSAESLAALDRVLEFAAKRKGHLTLFHKVATVPSLPFLDLAFTEQADNETALQVGLSDYRKLAEKYVQLGRDRGVKVDVIFDRSLRTNASQAILNRAKRSGSMIALASRSGLVSATLLGSLSRKLIRYAQQPIWVLHPRPRARTQAGARREIQRRPNSAARPELSPPSWQ